MSANNAKFLSNPSSVGSAVAKVNGTPTNSQGIGSALSGIASRAKNLLPGGMPGLNRFRKSANFASASMDWRVKLSFPSNPAFADSSVLAPLIATGGLVFPYTPAIQIIHSASYSEMSPIHNNYPFLSYENSKVDAITITAPFYIEDAAEAAYWVGAMHFLRSATKMQFGNDKDAGAPPPILQLDGYGDYVFKSVPVVIKSFTMDLPNDSDYISTGLAPLVRNVPGLPEPLPDGVGWAPVKSTVAITVQPLYSRQQVRRFSLDDFVSGEYVLGLNQQGFI
jgi:hypothetical protein